MGASAIVMLWIGNVVSKAVLWKRGLPDGAPRRDPAIEPPVDQTIDPTARRIIAAASIVEHGKTIQDQRHAVKDFFPNYIPDCTESMTDKETRQTGVEDSPVEITPEMIEGGAALLRTWDSELVPPEQMASEVFRVMGDLEPNRSLGQEDRI